VEYSSPVKFGTKSDSPLDGTDPNQSSESPRRLLAFTEAAKYLAVSRATIERLAYRGELPIVKVGGSTRFDVGDLNDYIDRNRRRNRQRIA
jgi:excisionase family DNA binding protein